MSDFAHDLEVTITRDVTNALAEEALLLSLGAEFVKLAYVGVQFIYSRQNLIRSSNSLRDHSFRGSSA